LGFISHPDSDWHKKKELIILFFNFYIIDQIIMNQDVSLNRKKEIDSIFLHLQKALQRILFSFPLK